MTSRAQLAPSPLVPGLLRRWTLLCCALLFTVFSSAQAAHIHGNLLGKRQAQVDVQSVVSGDSDEAHCPFCTMAHSVVPTAQPAVIGQIALVEVIVSIAQERPPIDRWHYARFGRPPPSNLSA